MSGVNHRSGLVLACILMSSVVEADSYLDAQREFETFQRQQQSSYRQSVDEFEQYQRRLQQAFDRYQAEGEKIWGKKRTVMPDSHTWVSYLGDLQHRGVVDFQTGQVTVELAVERPRQDRDRRQLEDTVLKLLEQGKDPRSMLDLARDPVARPVGDPVLSGQVADRDGTAATPENYPRLAARVVEQLQIDQVTGGDGQRRTVYRVQLHLVADHIRRRAALYQQDVHRFAEQQAMPAALIYAIMETESMFNPMARSPAPAFGLMQLVPNSGAREAYRYLFKQDRVVNDRYLYDPSNNIRLGSAFLNRLYYLYFADIKDRQTRIWATVAAYNTGAGNVFRTFAGRYSRARFGTRARWKQAALREINRRSPEQVYTFMRRHLPYQETRSYLKKVRARIGKYQIPEGA